MTVKTEWFFKIRSLIFIVIFLFPVFSFSRDNTVNFSVSTNNLYFPDDEIKLNLNSYDYSEKPEDNRKIKFTFEVLKIKDISAFYSKQTSRYSLDVLGRDSTNLAGLTEEVYSFSKNIKPRTEYGYLYINETFPVNVRSKGAYLVKAVSGNKVAYCGFIISELGMISKAGNNSLLAFVVDRKTGEPVSDVSLDFFTGSKKIGSGKTSDGIYYQPFTNSDSNKSDADMTPMIAGKYNEDVVVSDCYFYFGYSGNRYYTYIYTEQPVYRTNSVVNFKGIIRKNNFSELEPLKDKELEIVIKDSKGTEVYRQNTKTNSTGSFDGTYKIAEEAPLGNYTVYANIDEINSYTAEFSVEQYKKPEFIVSVTSDKSQYYGKDNIKAEIDAKYYFGSPVTEAQVEYNVYKVKYYKPWWKYSEYAWWYEDYFENEEDNDRFRGAEFVYSGTGVLDNNGRLEVSYTVNEDFSEMNYYEEGWYRPYYSDFDYKYIVQAKVTDKSRREITGNTSVFVTRGGFYLSARTDRYLYKPGENVKIEVNAINFADKPVETEFEVKIFKTAWSGYSDKIKKDLIASLNGKTLKDGKGIISFDLDETDSDGGYTAEISAKDEKSNIIKSSTYFYVTSGENRWYDNVSGGVQIITDKDSYRHGETCKAMIIVSDPEVTALITTNTDDIISYRTEKFKSRILLTEFPVTDKYMSNFEINIDYVYKGNLVSSGKSVLVIPEEKLLTVEVLPSKQIYLPREEGSLKVRVTDNSGNPVSNAEVSIGIVDESIYSIKEDNTKDIRKFFYGKKNLNVSTAYNNNYNSAGISRFITVFERFSLKSLSTKDLATVKGVLLKKNGNPLQNAIIVVDDDYQAAVTDYEGNFEFMLPEGEYTIGAYYGNTVRDDLAEITLRKGQTKTITLYNRKELNDGKEFNEGVATDQPEMRNGRGDLSTMKSAPEMMMKDKKAVDADEFTGENLIQPDVRSDFRDAIFWSPYSVTDADGFATVSVNYPDNLTSWRITSRVITEDSRVGQIVSNVITRKDLIIRMETPRFLQEKDEVTISTVIHNYLEGEKKTVVKFSCSNLQNLSAEEFRTVSIPPDSDIRLDWKVKVTEPSGEAVLFAEALTDEESDAVEMKVPLQPAGLKKEKGVTADFSDVTKTEIKNVVFPSGTDLRSASVKINADASLASAILTALDDLTGYPYGCVEQTMSRFLPTIVVANALKELNAPLNEKTKSAIPDMVSKGLLRLYSMQHSDGGWGWWENDNTNPYMTAYVIYGLSLAREIGYDVNPNVLKRGIKSAKSQLKNNDIDPTVRAYILYSLTAAGESNIKLIEENSSFFKTSDLNDYSRSLLAMAWYKSCDKKRADEELNKLISGVKLIGESAAYWEGKEFHYRWQDDKVQTTAAALKAIIMINPGSDLKEKIVRWLMLQKIGKSWRNTQETAMVIFSLTDYLKYSGEMDPDYVLKVFVNGSLILEKNMTKDDIYKKSEPVNADNKLLKQGDNEIRIEKNGKGKVYFTADTYYYSEGDQVKAGEENFRVEREYFILEKYDSYNEEKITYRKKYFDGNVKSGDEIFVKIKVYSKEDNQYFMLEDPLPGGSEIVKDDWAYTIEDESNYRSYPYYYWRWWYADKEVRDNRVTFFATYIGKGEYEFSYIFQPQIPGEYNVNPSKALLMYYPEYNGNTESFKINVTD